jgi:hypothetical protein
LRQLGKRLQALFGGSVHEDELTHITGVVYVPNSDPGPMMEARIGAVIDRKTDEPPWIVVDLLPSNVLAANWPGRLWQVQVLRKAPQQPMSYANYVRATAVRVTGSLSIASMFDENGPAIVDVLNEVSSLTHEQADLLSGIDDSEAARIHNQIWDQWLSANFPSSPHVGEDHAGTISHGSRGAGSPVGRATSILSSELHRRARELDGDLAFVFEGEEQYFSEKWRRVAANLQHMLFAVGVEHPKLDALGRDMLARAYRSVLPDPK